MDCFTVLMEHSVSVFALVTSTDAGGGVVNDYSTLRQADVPCLLCVQPGGELEMFDQTQWSDKITGACFYNGIQRGDKVVVTAGPSLVGASIRLDNVKDQPGVDALGFDELIHFFGTRLS